MGSSGRRGTEFLTNYAQRFYDLLIDKTIIMCHINTKGICRKSDPSLTEDFQVRFFVM